MHSSLRIPSQTQTTPAGLLCSTSDRSVVALLPQAAADPFKAADPHRISLKRSLHQNFDDGVQGTLHDTTYLFLQLEGVVS